MKLSKFIKLPKKKRIKILKQAAKDATDMQRKTMGSSCNELCEIKTLEAL